MKDGEKGIAILAPLVYRKKCDDGKGELPNDDDAARVVRGFKVVHVFDVSRTEGGSA